MAKLEPLRVYTSDGSTLLYVVASGVMLVYKRLIFSKKKVVLLRELTDINDAITQIVILYKLKDMVNVVRSSCISTCPIPVYITDLLILTRQILLVQPSLRHETMLQISHV